MKKSLLALSLVALSASAFAQAGTSATGSATGTGSAAIGDIGITSIMNMPATNPFTMAANSVNYSGRYRVDGVPVNSAASSFSSSAVWRCSTAGTGGALGTRDFQLSFAFGGGESGICVTEFRGAVVGGYFDRARAAEALPDSDPGKAAAKDAVVALRATICEDEKIANSLEATKGHQCAEPLTTESRQARWTRERQAKTAAAQTISINGQQVAVLPGVPAARQQPKPWEAGG